MLLWKDAPPVGYGQGYLAVAHLYDDGDYTGAVCSSFGFTMSQACERRDADKPHAESLYKAIL